MSRPLNGLLPPRPVSMSWSWRHLFHLILRLFSFLHSLSPSTSPLLRLFFRVHRWSIGLYNVFQRVSAATPIQRPILGRRKMRLVRSRLVGLLLSHLFHGRYAIVSFRVFLFLFILVSILLRQSRLLLPFNFCRGPVDFASKANASFSHGLSLVVFGVFTYSRACTCPGQLSSICHRTLSLIVPVISFSLVGVLVAFTDIFPILLPSANRTKVSSGTCYFYL